MEQIQSLLNNYTVYIIMGLGLIVVVLFFMLVQNSLQIRGLKKRLNKFMEKEDVNLEELLTQYTEKLQELVERNEEMKEKLNNMEYSLKSCVQKVGVVRYQAIENMGGDLSYTVALLDEVNDGVVLNGIYGRNGSYTYAKPLENGTSSYNLSEEEEQAIQKAMQKKSV